MNNKEVASYFKFIVLPDEVKRSHKIELNPKNTRLDCILSFNPINWKGFDFCLPQRGNTKDMLSFTVRPANYDPKVPRMRRAKYQLQKSVKGKTYNITSIFYEYSPGVKQLAFGNLPDKKTLGVEQKVANTFYTFRNDLFLMIIERDYSELELLIIPEGDQNQDQHLRNLISGEYDEVLSDCRQQSKLFYNYKNLEHERFK